MLLGNADTIVQHLCPKLGWDLPFDPRQKGALAQSAQAQAILGKRPSSSADFTDGSEKPMGPTRVGDRYGLATSSYDVYSTDAPYFSVMCGCLMARMAEGG
jgi:hypothetical protein